MKNKEQESPESIRFREGFNAMRRRLRISQQRIHELTGISNNHISLIERGLRKPSPSVASTSAGSWHHLGGVANHMTPIRDHWFHMKSISKADATNVQTIGTELTEKANQP